MFTLDQLRKRQMSKGAGSRASMIYGEVGSEIPVPVIHPSSVLAANWVACPELRAWYLCLNHYWFQFTRISLAVNCSSWGLWFTIYVRLKSGGWRAFWAQQPLQQLQLTPHELEIGSWNIFLFICELFCLVLLGICMLDWEQSKAKSTSWKAAQK